MDSVFAKSVINFLTSDCFRNNSYKLLSATSLITILLFRFSFSILFCFLVVAVLGYFCAQLLFNNGDETLYWDIIKLLQTEELCNRESRNQPHCQELFEKDFEDSGPWRNVRIPETVNEALEELIEQILDNYFNSWYKTDINGDAAFVNEIRYQIRYASALILQKIYEIDLSKFILYEAAPVAVLHCSRIASIEQQIDKKILSPHMIENQILDRLDDLHYALSSRQNELNYLRQLADLLIASFVDETHIAGYSNDDDSPLLKPTNRRWPSQACHHFLRELVVFSFLLPVLDLLADPDTINRLLILLFDPEPLPFNEDPDVKKVSVLHGLTDFASGDLSDSLLQLKLSEVLRDMRNLQMFSMYLKDVNGPLNELYFLLHSGDVHERMLNIQKENEGCLSEIYYDTWEIFRKYVHEGAQNKVLLPSGIVNDFQTAIEKRDTEILDRTLEKAFQLVYRHLQRDYLIPFCQSECYFGHLCGSPPISVEDLIVSENTGISYVYSAVSESTFSLSQFRRRLWKVIMPATTDGSVESFNQYNDLSNVQVPSEIEEVGNDACLSVKTPTSDISLSSFCGNSEFDSNNTDGSESGICVVRRMPTSLIESNASSDRQLFTTSCDVPLFDLERDLNRWVVNIPHIESRREQNTGRNIFVYVVSVERFDLTDVSSACSGVGKTEFSLNKWSVARRYNEFYILESKLMEFHGVLLKTQPLPPRKPFSKKTREFVEAHRLHFQRFLQLLTQQNLLKKSDLLFAFLTSDQEFKDNIQLSGLNPWNMVRKMPSKFSRERGQNLRPFLLSLLANTLASHSKSNSLNAESLHHYKLPDQSFSITQEESEGVCRPRLLLINSIFGDNFSLSKVFLLPDNIYKVWTRSLSDTVLFLLDKVYSVQKWLFAILTSFRFFAGSSFDLYVDFLLRKVLDIAFVDSNCVRMVRLIQDALFGENSCSPTEQERFLRAELSLRRTLEYLEEELPTSLLKGIGLKKFRSHTCVLFHTLQYPRINKQLSYVLLDAIAQKLVPIPES